MARDILRHGHWLPPEINGVPMPTAAAHAWLIAIAAWPVGAVPRGLAQLPPPPPRSACGGDLLDARLFGPCGRSARG
jgi:hypothetical protein